MSACENRDVGRTSSRLQQKIKQMFANLSCKDTLHRIFIDSKLQYGILTWSSAKKNELGAFSTRLNKMINTITFAKKFCHVSPIFKALNLLKIDDIYQLELGKFMYQTFNGNIPQKIDKDFIKLSSVHKHTRHTINKFHLPQLNTWYGQKMLLFAGDKLCFKLDPDLKSHGWLSFKKHFKRKNFWKSMMIKACS